MSRDWETRRKPGTSRPHGGQKFRCEFPEISCGDCTRVENYKPRETSDFDAWIANIEANRALKPRHADFLSTTTATNSYKPQWQQKRWKTKGSMSHTMALHFLRVINLCTFLRQPTQNNQVYRGSLWIQPPIIRQLLLLRRLYSLANTAVADRFYWN